MSYLPEGTLLNGGKLRVVRFLSKGGFGCTYEVEHVVLGTRSAIKEFFVSDFCNRDTLTNRVTIATESKRELVEKLKRKFADEAKAVAKFNHPNIVRVTDIFDENDTSYFVMDFIDGRSVAQIVDEEGAIPEDHAVKIILQICDALEYVHAHNRLHLDIKPANIMVDNSGYATLIDFGVSKQYDEVSGENTSTLMGYSVSYAPAEQLSAEVKKFLCATDIYALGATLYKMLSGKTPPRSTDLATGDRLPPLPDHISKSVAEAVYAAMNSMKFSRPQSVAAFRTLLTTPMVKVEDTPKPDNVTVYPSDKNKTVILLPKSKTSEQPAPKPSVSKPQVSDPTPQNPPKKRTGIIVGICIAAVVLLLCFLLLGSKSEPAEDSAPETEEIEEPDTPKVTKSYDSNISERPIETFTVNGVQFTMIPVDGGKFRMGATREQISKKFDPSSGEFLVHNVTLTDYWIGETEVTQELWEAVMGNNPSYSKGSKQPVENVSWNDCQEFLDALNALVEDEYKFRLPTEAEWEYAARGGKNSKGYIFSGSDSIDLVAWYKGNSDGHTHEVKTLTPNELGIYDMSGNAWEWCNDWDGLVYRQSSRPNPQGPDSGTLRVQRGGCVKSPSNSNRVAYRLSNNPENTNSSQGFRLALSSPN